MKIRPIALIFAVLALPGVAGIAAAAPPYKPNPQMCNQTYGMRATGETTQQLGFTLTSYERYLVGANCHKWPKGVYQCTMLPTGGTVCAPKGTNFALFLQNKMSCRSEGARQICLPKKLGAVGRLTRR